MGGLKSRRFTAFYEGRQSVNYLHDLLIEILTLQDKLGDLKEQSFCFQNGEQSNRDRLENLKKEYNRLMFTVNNNDINFFITRIRECEEMIAKLKSIPQPTFMNEAFLASTQDKLQYYKTHLGYKGKFGVLLPLEELVKDEESLRKVYE